MPPIEEAQVILLGIMSSLKTGRLVFDLLLVIMLPMIYRHLETLFNKVWVLIKRRSRDKLNRQYLRTIEFSRSNCRWSEAKAAHKNKVLVNAIRSYIGRNITPAYCDGEIKLQEISSSSSNRNGKTMVESLEKNFHVLTVPARDQEVEVEILPGLFYKDVESVNRQDDGDKKSKNLTHITTLTFRTSVSGGQERVESFIRKAYDWYVDQIEATEDHSFFMYQPLVGSSGSGSKDSKKEKRTEFKRYKLSGEKTFRSIFFPEKPRVLQILRHFADKSGKYAIAGFPHKLGLLLHGPPGTGKTSLVKAIAAHMKRHIISVPLSRIHTNQELMNVMFDQVFPYKGAGTGGGGGGDDDDDDDGGNNNSGGGTNKHKINEVIFLLEDVDAASKVVHAREPVDSAAKIGAKDDGESTMTRQLSQAITRQATSMTKHNSNSPAHPKSKAAAPAAEEAEVEEDEADKEEGSGGEDDENEDGEKKKKTKLKSKKKGLFETLDKLDLAGLLNVLDGVVDAPGRILVMTTNHPEKLDRALLRPGRVNMRIYMGFISCDDAIAMTEHYYPNTSPERLQTVRDAFEAKHRACANGLKMSPAEFEQLCAEATEIDDLVRAIQHYRPKRR